MRSRLKVKGLVTVRVLRGDGHEVTQVNHNVVTDQGDALIADLLSENPSQTKVDEANGFIELGTGWSGLSPKSNTGCNTPEGDRRGMDAGYPQAKGAFGNAEDNVVVYRVSWPVGSLTADGLDEAALMNADAGGVCLAYAQITPEINISANDTLQIEWELSFLGS